MNRTTSALLLALSSVPVFAGNTWSELRGPTRDGNAGTANPPLTWCETNNVVWKTPIHDLGWSSPVIWQEQVWLTSATLNGREMFAIAVDVKTGRVIHDVKIFENSIPEHVASVNSYASPTSAIEADRVYVHYGTYGTACLDTRGGKIIWSRRDLNCDHHEGPGSSLMLEGDRLYFNVDGRDVQYVVALDKNTGQTVWKTQRSVDYTPFPVNCRKAFCTPILITAAGRSQLFSPGAKAMMAYDPDTGTELWKARYNGWSMVPRPLFAHGLLYVITDYERPELWAVRPDGLGDVTETHVAWKAIKDMPATASLVLVGDLLYMVNDQGFALCVEALTGNVVWRERLKGKHSASPICAADRVYFFSEKNLTTVIKPGREFQVLAENQLDDRLMATPAVTGNAFILRSKTHLYRLEEMADLQGQRGAGQSQNSPEPIPLLSTQGADGEFAGWRSFHEKPGTTTGDVWRLGAEGVLVCKGVPRGYLYSEQSYSNFVLQFEWRYPTGTTNGKGGVLVRLNGENAIWPKSLEFQLNMGQAGDFWGIRGFEIAGPTDGLQLITNSPFGTLRHLKRSKNMEKPAGEWNQFEGVLQDGKATQKVNGVNVNEASGCELEPGKIALTAEGQEIQFRNIRLLPLR